MRNLALAFLLTGCSSALERPPASDADAPFDEDAKSAADVDSGVEQEDAGPDVPPVGDGDGDLGGDGDGDIGDGDGDGPVDERVLWSARVVIDDVYKPAETDVYQATLRLESSGICDDEIVGRSIQMTSGYMGVREYPLRDAVVACLGLTTQPDSTISVITTLDGQTHTLDQVIDQPVVNDLPIGKVGLRFEVRRIYIGIETLSVDATWSLIATP